MATLKEAGKHLDLSIRQVKNLIDQGVLPQSPRSQIDLDVYRIAYIRHQRGQLHGRNNSSLTLDEERKRLISAQASLEELKLKEKEGFLIPADAVEEVMIGKVMAARAKFLAFPTRIAPLVMTCNNIREVEEIARDLIYEALNELADEGVEDAQKRYEKNMLLDKQSSTH